ncbi:MAG: glycosyl transferase [Zunongwangia sp.]|jgi:glycosyltransferase involved in cell wall biosynthesis|nr:glycosyl transferase [Flavobacteriaceae bacterium]MAO35660.1 glycosyl transferase [Zunongwangia sp.]|tara:strand:+ start:1028 stop:1909 length:882 start_codon:yes stop_codon:yes gene_type:complete
MVSVFMLTYNQEDYIEKALLSILSQKTAYTFQIVIGDDCSTDKTKEIIELYARKFPDIFKVYFWSENLGLIQNYIKTFAKCEGKYISICDGDDYWIDDERIQRQVNFLEANKEFSIIYGRNYNLSKNQKLTEGRNNPDNEFNFNDLIFKNFIPSVTVLFKRVELHKEMQEWLSQFPYGDWPTYLLTCNDGSKIYFEDKFVAVYRKYDGVSFHLRQDHLKVLQVNYQILNCIFRDNLFRGHRKVIGESIAEQKLAIAAQYFENGSFKLSIKWGISPFLRNPLRVSKLYFYLVRK